MIYFGYRGYYSWFRPMTGGFLSGGTCPPGVYDDTPLKYKGLKYKSAPRQRPLHKTRFR